MASLYLDDCLDGDYLIGLLRQAGHDVEHPRNAGTRGWDDRDHLDFATRHGATLITQNAGDVLQIHAEW